MHETTYLNSSTSSVPSASPSPSPSRSLGGEALISKICLDLTPSGQRLLLTPLHIHSPQTHSSKFTAWRPRIPAQVRWNPRSQPSQTTTCPRTSGLPQAAQAEPRPPPGTPAGAPGGGEGLSWYERTTSRESGRVSGGEGISLRSMPRPERVGSAAAAAESLSSSLLESVSSIIRVGVERWRWRSVSSDLALVPLLRLRLTICSRSDG